MVEDGSIEIKILLVTIYDDPITTLFQNKMLPKLFSHLYVYIACAVQDTVHWVHVKAIITLIISVL